MQFFFDIPAIKDQLDFTKLLDKSKVDPQKWVKIEQAQSFREQFRTMMNMENVINLVSVEDGLLNYQPIMEGYLKCNVDMLEYIGYNKDSQQPNFEYESFINNAQKTYNTEKIEKPEAFAAELLMVRYSYAFAYQLDAFKYLQKIKNQVLQNLNNQQNMPIQYLNEPQQAQKRAEIDALEQNIKKTLNNYKIGYEKIFKVNNVVNDLLFFLVQKQQTLIPELKATTLYFVKLIMECNANGVYIENLISQANIAQDPVNLYYEIAQVSKSTLNKLTETQNRCFEIKNEIKQDIFDFLSTAIPFYQAMGMVYLAKYNEINMKNDEFAPGKNYTTVSGEQLVLAQQVLTLYQSVKSIQNKGQEMHYLPYAQQYFSQVFYPYASKMNQIHAGIKNKTVLPVPMNLLNEIPAKDYFENVNPV